MRIVHVQNLDVAYDNKLAVEAVSFDIFAGDYICVVGENGSGKSTLVKAILGLKAITRGQIAFENGLNQREIGYLPQQSHIQRDFPASVQEVVRSGCLNKTGLFPFYRKAHKERANHLMESLSIAGLKRKSYRELSGGQQQRVLLARGLCATDKLLVLDEPVSGLDPLVTAEFYALISQLNREQGMTVLMVSHDMAAAVQYAGKILHMDKTVKFFGSVEDYNTGRYWEDRRRM